jgi:hypothetical protein
MTKLHLPAVISKRRDSETRRSIFDALIGGVSVEAETPQDALHNLRVAVMQMVSNPCTFVQVALNGTVFTIQIGTESGTGVIRAFRGKSGNTSQVGPDEIVEVEEGQRLEWLLEQYVLGYDRAMYAES